MSYVDLDPKNLANTPRSYNPTLTDRRAVDIASGNSSARGYTVDRNTTNAYKPVKFDMNVDQSTGVIVGADGSVKRIPAGSGGTYDLPPGSTLIVDSKNIDYSSTSNTNQKKPCLADVIGGFFNDVKGALGGIVRDITSTVKGAINDVKNIIGGIKDIVSCVDLEFSLGKISIDGILNDIKNAVVDGINNAINFVKGIIDQAKELRAFLTCEKGTKYERQAKQIDDQLATAADEDDYVGAAMTKSSFTSGRAGTDIPMSPRRRRDIANGNASGRLYIQNQVTQSSNNTLNQVKNNARKECQNNNSGRSITGMVDSLNVTNYG